MHDLVTLARRRGVADDPIVRRRIAAAFEHASTLRSLGYKGFASFAQGSYPARPIRIERSPRLGGACFRVALPTPGEV